MMDVLANSKDTYLFVYPSKTSSHMDVFFCDIDSSNLRPSQYNPFLTILFLNRTPVLIQCCSLGNRLHILCFHFSRIFFCIYLFHVLMVSWSKFFISRFECVVCVSEPCSALIRPDYLHALHQAKRSQSAKFFSQVGMNRESLHCRTLAAGRHRVDDRESKQ